MVLSNVVVLPVPSAGTFSIRGSLACRATFAHSKTNVTDNWAVVVSSSRYWLNYRHTANALGVYQAIKRLGIPDSNIILMLADQPSCSPRNIYPGQLYLAPGGPAAGTHSNSNLQGGTVEVDYRGREVGVDSVLRVLTGHHVPGTPASKRLRSGPSSRVLLYLTGHGGDEFLKFHDQEELLAADLASAVHQMHALRRYGQLLLLADTCQASTLYSRIKAPGVLGVASSKLGQSSYAHHVDSAIGQHIVDQLTFHLHHFLNRLPPAVPQQPLAQPPAATSPPSMDQLLSFLSAQRLASDVQVRTDLLPRRLTDLPVTEFFAAVEPGVVAAAQQAASRGSSDEDAGSSGAQALLLLGRLQEQPVDSAVQSADTVPQQAALPLFEVLQARVDSQQARGQRGDAAALAALWAVAVGVASWLLVKT